jgi:Mg2+ and Co2+ transporter CorA
MAYESLAPRLRVPIEWQLPPDILERLGDRAGRQRAMSADGHLLIVLHEPPKPGVSERTGRLFWRNPQGNWSSNSLGAGLQSLNTHLAEFTQRIDTLEKRLETAQTANDYYSLLRTIAPLYRTARYLHAALQQAREMVPDDRDVINARDQATEIERALELMHGDASHGLDFTIARQAEDQAEASFQMSIAGYRLNLLAAMFFPIATIATVFGMNLRHGFEDDRTGAVFWSLLVVGLACGTVLALAIAKKPVRRPKRPSLPGKCSGSTRETTA